LCVCQGVRVVKYLLHAVEEPEEDASDSEFDWDYFEEVTGKMREIIESESPFRCGETRVTDYGFSYELVDERGRCSGIELHENFNEGVALVDAIRIVEHLKKLHEQIQHATHF